MRYSIFSGDPDAYFSIDPTSGNIRIATALDRETKAHILLNVQATSSGDPPTYGHTQVIMFECARASECSHAQLTVGFSCRPPEEWKKNK